ncbi:MAG: choice-of-anchor D domain-containing protein [Bacteroidetes bacterium]|nr:choice-of-anchor D domain-containing protein [Bacteroidota bacterium]
MRRVFRYLLLPMLLVLLVSLDASAQGSGKFKNFPVPFGPTNSGRDFWFAIPANWDSPSASQYYIRLYITSGVRTQVRVWAGAGIKKTFYTKPYDIITVDLTPIEAQMFTRSDVAPVPDDQIYHRRAVHVDADAPIVVYVMNRTSFTSDGLLALPVNAIGRDYVVGSYAAVIGGTQELPSQFMVIAPFNNTTVTVDQPSATPNHAAGAHITMTLDSGDVYSAMTLGYGGDMSGAVIHASKPVTVTAGQACTYIPNQINFCCCDHLCETMLPISSWGRLYQAVPFQTRLKGDFYRVFAGDNNTSVYVNGQKYATLSQVGGDEGIGWFEYRALGKELVEFRSDKPISVEQYNTSQDYDGVPTDPFYLALTPVEQFQTQLTFCTPSADFPQNYINLIADSLTFNQLELAPGGTDQWVKLWTYNGVGVPKPYPTLVNGRRYVGVIIDIKPGVYQLRGPQPFAGYIYGFSAYDSYGYPLSVAVGDLSRPDTSAPEIVKTVTCDGSADVTTFDLPDDPKIRTNLATIELDPDSASTYNYDFFADHFEAGVSVSSKYYLRVTDKTKPAQAVVVISDMAGNITLDTVVYRPFNVTIEPKNVDFGQINVGDKKQMPVVIRNLAAEPATVKAAQLLSGSNGFVLLSPTGTFTLGPAGGGADIMNGVVEFTATKTGTFEDSLGLRDTCGMRYIAHLTIAVGMPVIKVSDLDYKSVVVGVSVTKTMVITDSADVGILHITGATGPTQNTIFTLPDGLPAFPFDLKPHETKLLRVTFTPPATQTYNDQIVFDHNAPPNPDNDPVGKLTGIGIQASLTATSYQWPAIRLGRSGVPAQVMLKNYGSAPVQITNVTMTGDTGDFTLDAAKVNGLTLKALDSVLVDVTFTPTAVGPRKMTVTYDANPPQSSPVITELEGTGIDVKLATQDYDFGSMNVGDPEVNQSVRFQIPPGPYLDSVVITGFRFRTDQTGGTDDYRYLPLNPAVTLDPISKPTFDFTGYFKATAGGVRTAELEAISADVPGVISHWTGRGLVRNASIAGTGGAVGSLCVGDSGVINATVENNGVIPLTVDSLVTGNGAFVVETPATPFVVGPGEVKQVIVRYHANVAGTVNAQLFVFNSTTDVPRLDLPLSGTSRSDVVNSSLRLIGTKGANVELGHDMVAEVSVPALPAGAMITAYRVTFTYDTTQLWARTAPTDIVLGSINTTGAAATLNTVLTKKGVVVIDVALTIPITQSGVLLTMPYGVLFTKEDKRSLAVTVDVPSTSCLVVNPSNNTINVEPICGLSLRLIELTSKSYNLDQNKPNPFNPTTQIQYSLGLDGPTQMYLYDANGKLVQKLIDEVQQPGTYELTLDMSNLPSGNYYYKIVSGTWSETKMLTVVK